MTDVVQMWSAHLANNRRRSPHTVRAYAATAERLMAFLQGHYGGVPDLAAVEASDLRAFLARRRSEGISNISAARELSAVRAFITFAGGEGAMPRVKGPRVKKGLPRPISPDDVIALAEDVADQTQAPWAAARDWAVLMLLYGVGLRISEALGLTGAIIPLGETISVTGKRNKTRIVPLLAPVREAVEAYIALCPFPCARRGCGWGWVSAPPHTRSAIPSRRTCSRGAQICAACRNCSAMRV
jgi:integrase/recombinase XerC